jgi:hypothetical protein
MRTDQTQSVGAVIADDQHKRAKIPSVNLHKGIGPAISRLPAELLSEIFMHTLPPFDEFLSPSKLRPPMLLTRICRRWREVVVGTPNLWCRLFSGFMSSHHRRRKREAFCYNTWLKRSRGLPLSLALTCCPDPLTGLLQPYTNQISSLRIVYCAATRDLLLNDLPALQVLTVDRAVDRHIGVFRYGGSVAARSILNHSFTLHSLKVSGPSFIFYLADFDPFKNSRWPHLTHIEITVRQQNVLLRLLQQAPNLSSAKISILLEYKAMHPPLPVEPCTHTKLQLLHINCPRVLPSLPNLLDALSLPGLREFMAGSVWTRWPHNEFKAFLARSKCPLELLNFGDAMTTPLELDYQRSEYIALVSSLEVVNPTGAHFIRCFRQF